MVLVAVLASSEELIDTIAERPSPVSSQDDAGLFGARHLLFNEVQNGSPQYRLRTVLAFSVAKRLLGNEAQNGSPQYRLRTVLAFSVAKRLLQTEAQNGSPQYRLSEMRAFSVARCLLAIEAQSVGPQYRLSEMQAFSVARCLLGIEAQSVGPQYRLIFSVARCLLGIEVSVLWWLEACGRMRSVRSSNSKRWEEQLELVVLARQGSAWTIVRRRVTTKQRQLLLTTS